MISPIDTVPRGAFQGPETRDRALREAALALEASFISLMLKESGLGKTGAFGGGAGEEHFGSFLRDLHAREIAGSGGIGLAENIYRALQERTDGQG